MQGVSGIPEEKVQDQGRAEQPKISMQRIRHDSFHFASQPKASACASGLSTPPSNPFHFEDSARWNPENSETSWAMAQASEANCCKAASSQTEGGNVPHA